MDTFLGTFLTQDHIDKAKQIKTLHFIIKVLLNLKGNLKYIFSEKVIS